MSAKYKRRSLDEVFWENEYLLILVYLIYALLSLSFLALRTLKDKIVGR
jgi:hypothetical protein